MDNIPTDTVPEVGQDSTEEVKKETTETPSPDVQKLISEQIEIVKRQVQSEKDKAIAEIRREAERKTKFAESRAGAYESVLKTADEELKPLAEKARITADSQFYREFYEQQESEKRAKAYDEQLAQSLRDEVTALGIDPDDKGLDYANNATDYFTGRKRFTESVSKILKGKEIEREKQMDSKWTQLETDFRKKHGLDSQDTTVASGVVNQSEADFMADFGSGKLDMTQENLKRHTEIQKKYYK